MAHGSGGRDGWRLGGVVAAFAVALAGCERDPRPACSAAYQHLVALAKRNADPEGEAKFISACTEAWDQKRVECIEAARTVGEALACKAVKKRPG